MRLHRFFIGERLPHVGEALVVSQKELLHQWGDVLRLTRGDRVMLFDGEGSEFMARIEQIKKNEARLFIEEKREGKRPARDLWLFIAIPKKDKFELVVEKATELGVSHIVPLFTARDEKRGMNEARLRRITVEAAEQSGRSVLPMLHGAFDLGEALAKHRFPLVAAHPEGAPFVPEAFARRETLGVLIGPEGGWSEKELALFSEKEIPLVSFGPLTLRTETAAIAAATLFLL